MNSLTLKTQELPFDHPDSTHKFLPGPEKPFVTTPAAVAMYQLRIIIDCLLVLQEKAHEHDGVDYLQVFEDTSKPENLWFIEDQPGGAITALLPSDY